MLRLFPIFNSTWMGKNLVKTLERVWRYSSCLTAGGGIYEELCCRPGWSFPVISRSANTRAQIQTDGADRVDVDLKIQLFSNRAVGTMQVRAIHLHKPTILSCLYYDSSNCVNSILWFLYLRSSKTSSTVCLWFILPFFFLVLTSSPLPIPRSRLQREVNSRSVFYQGTFTLNLQDMTLAGRKWSWTGLQTETSQQNGRPEWPNCTLNLNLLISFCIFLFVTSLFCFLLTCMLFLSFTCI